MKDKDASSHKKSSPSSGARSAKRTGAGNGPRRRKAAVPAGGPARIEARFRAVFECSRDAIGVSKVGVHIFVNPAYLDLFGFPPGTDLAGKPVLDLIAPESRDQIKAYILRRERGEAAPTSYETRGLRLDGSVFDMEVNVFLYQENGEDHTLVILRDITGRKRVEEALRESEARLRTVTENAPDTILQVDRQGIIRFVNRPIPGLSVEQIIGSSVQTWVPKDQHEVVAQALEEAFTTGRQQEYESSGPGPHGGTRFYSVRVMPVMTGGDTDSAVYIATDITERKQADEALKQSEEKYRRLYNETPVLLQAIDRDGILVAVNDYWLQTLGYERSEVIGRKSIDFLTEASRKYAQEVVLPVFFLDGIVKDIAYQFVKKNGAVVDVLLAATAERDAAGNVVRSQAVIQDVTARRRSEDERRRSERMLQTIIDAEPACVKLLDENANIIMMNRAGLDMAQADSMDQMIDQCICACITPENRPAFLDLTRRVFQGESGTLSFEIIGKKGRHLWLETHAVPLRNEKDVIVAFLGVTRDITERKRVETALQESERFLSTLIGNLPGMAYRCRNDRNWTMEFVSEGAIGLTGYQSADLIGNATIAYNDLIHPDDQEAVWNAVQQAERSRDKYTLHYRIRRADGQERWVWEQGRGVFSEAGELLALEGFIIDETDSRLLEEERLKSQKLESLGTLAGGIAHDFNNLLQGIFGFISMARLTFDQKEKSLAMLAQAEKALHQSVNLTSQLLTFSKGGKPVKKALDVRSVIENSTAFALSGSRVTCEIIVDKDLRTVEADEGQLGQVIQNIVLNADQAMPLGGRIRISVRNVDAAAIVPPTALQGYLVEISIHDQGAGIPAEHVARIFDPYFTTKEKGSGLGLATAYSIIKNHGGLMRVQSAVGKGTTFLIYLPASGAAVEEPKQPARAAATRKARILVMDDEEVIRSVACELLASIGHEVTCAESGETALEAYQAARDAGRPFDLVILDLTIRGGMGGIETLRKLAEIDPDVKAVVSSGYSDDAALSNYRTQGFRAFLKKPYTIEELQSTLKVLLA